MSVSDLKSYMFSDVQEGASLYARNQNSVVVQPLVTSRTVRVSNPSRGKKFSSFQNETRLAVGLTCSVIISSNYWGEVVKMVGR